MNERKNRILLVILDGWGHSEQVEYNAIKAAKTPNWDRFLENHPNSKLKCSGAEVGLPQAQMGNSEVGHVHIGAGRLIEQDLSRINRCIAETRLTEIDTLNQQLNSVARKNSSLHILGLLSDGGVHSHIEHTQALISVALKKRINQIYIHAFLDGRDTPPKSALQYIDKIESICRVSTNVKIASLVGRYFAMDRNNNWDRIELAHKLISDANSIHHAPSAREGLLNGYARGETDEFLLPTSINYSETEKYRIKNSDLGLFVNFRADRARQLTESLTGIDFKKFSRRKEVVFNKFVTMTDYGDSFYLPIIFPQTNIKNTFGEVISDCSLRQLRIAETEKYAHVTFFFNGGKESCFPGENRLLIPSPDVATYDLKPEMSALELSNAICAAIKSENYDSIISNFANADMVGHTGIFEATVKAIETLDSCLGMIAETSQHHNVDLLITADHGNAENMYSRENSVKEQLIPHTAHTNNLVPLLYIGESDCRIIDGELKDIAPTMLELLGIDTPFDMTGKSLLRPTK